jgi:hypothetical protein
MNSIFRTVLGLACLGFAACAADASSSSTDVTDDEASLPQISGPAIGFGCRAPKIALRTANGNYVVAENGGGAEVKADRIAAGPWETFTVGDEGFGKITLQANNGNYVVAEEGGGGAVNANRTEVGPWEVFTVERVSLRENIWAFKSANGNYVVAEEGGGGAVNANRTTLGPWEKFKVICM